MPKKLATAASWPTLVQERLIEWGRCINTQRLRQRIPVADLAARLGVSRTTVLRMEKGDPGAGAGAYLTALVALGVADQLAPAAPPVLWQSDYGQRVKFTAQERSRDDEYF
jgi:hypothetical protein